MTVPLSRTSVPPGELVSMQAQPLAGVRMLFVAPDDYPAFRVDLVELFSNHLVGKGLKIDWNLRPSRDFEGGVEERGTERFFLPRRRITEKFGGMRYAMRERWLRAKLAWRAMRGDYDIIQIRDEPLWGIPFGIAAKLSGTPMVFWMSFPVLEARLHNALGNVVPMGLFARLIRIVYGLVGGFLFFNLTLPLSDHVIVQSKRMRDRVGARGIATEKMTPIPMGVSSERFNAAAIAAVNDPRLAGRKSMAYMAADIFSVTAQLTFDALAALVEAGYDAVLVIVGTVSDHQRGLLAARLGANGLTDRVIFTGRLPLAEALGWVKRVDVCLSPFEMTATQQVATPTKLVEYLAMGRPVVATVHFDQSEVINRSGAGFVTAFSGEAMAEGVARLFDDPDMAERMGAKGPAWIRTNRDYSILADQVEKVYADLLSRRDARSGIEASGSPVSISGVAERRVGELRH